MNPWLISFTLAALIGFSGVGFYAGIQWCEGKQAEIDRIAQQEANRLETLRQQREAALLARARNLEDQANAQPVTAECGIPVDRVRRLNLR